MAELVPIFLQDAKRFVGQNHRHNRPPVGWIFGVGLEDGGKLVAVAITGRPVGKELQDGRTVEITRLCVTETEPPRNSCSMLYGACCRAAAALGYRRAYTYTLASEDAASVKAAGFTLDAELKPRPTWNCKARTRVQTDLFGNETRPSEAKRRWVRTLT